MSWKPAAVVVALALKVASIGPAVSALAPPAECVVIGAIDVPPFVSDAAECGRASSPASTFKIPHALIALQTRVITPATVVAWNGTRDQPEAWRRSHTVDSAIKWSVVPFFQHTARLIGAERMRARLTALAYAKDSFDGAVDQFWLNGDLAVTPLEQHAFLERLFAGRLPIDAAHVATVREALHMPAGQVTNAAGSHAFPLAWPGPLEVRVKTGNAQVKDERVSWLVGEVASRSTAYIVVARVRSASALASTAGLDAARRALDAFTTGRTP